MLTKAGAHVVPAADGYIMKQLLLEFTDSDAAGPAFYVELLQDSRQSIFEILLQKQVKWMWVMAQPAPVGPMAPPERDNLAEQGISSMYLTNSHLVLGAQEATAAYQIKDTYLQIAQVTVGILATIIGIVQIIVMYSTANSK